MENAMKTGAERDFRPYLDKKRDCVCCGGGDFSLWAESGIFKALECRDCGLVFINPCLNEEGLKIVYEGHHNSRVADREECVKRDKMYEIDRDFLLNLVDKGRILDVGCGGGFFLDKFSGKGWKKSGLEIDKDTVGYAKDRFGITDIRIWDSKTIPYPDKTFDAVVFRGSYEHMRDPHLVAREVKRVLKPNGYFYICATPNADSFCAKIYREKWNQFDAKEHIFMFSFKTLKRMIGPLGFTTVRTACFYEETPYCDLENDLKKVMADYKLYREGKREKMNVSPAFWGNMLNMILRKAKD